MSSREEQGAHGVEDAIVELTPVSAENRSAVCSLEVSDDQRRFVSSNAESLAQSDIEPHAVPFAICVADQIVGFLMLYDDGELPRIGLWRLMIAREFQGRGYGAAAVQRVLSYARLRPSVTEVVVGAMPGEGGPCAFYESLGFVRTGEIRDDGEIRYRRIVERTDG